MSNADIVPNAAKSNTAGSPFDATGQTRADASGRRSEPSMSVEAQELIGLAALQNQAAQKAGDGVQPTRSVDLKALLYATRGPIYGKSNDAVVNKTKERRNVRRVVQEACQTLPAALATAAALAVPAATLW